MHIEEGETFKSLYFMNLDKTKNEIIETAEKIFWLIQNVEKYSALRDS